MAEKVTVIFPAYNEGSNIRGAVSPLISWRRADPANRNVIIVNDGSMDATVRNVSRDIAQTGWQRFLQRTFGTTNVRKEVELINSDPIFRRNMGKGAAFLAGARRARQLGAEILVTIDADVLDATPAKIDTMVRELRVSEKDMVIANAAEHKSADGKFPGSIPKWMVGDRAIRMVTLEPLFRGKPKWVNLIQGYGMEVALNDLIRKKVNSVVEFTHQPALRTGAIKIRQQREIVKTLNLKDERKFRADKLREKRKKRAGPRIMQTRK